ncbi:endonuclease SmrB [Alteromonas sp. CYL-A6]|uniref:endonuclease SmrB n=1 Tax=Alteromonas nitratireducens TaxID=3390813 RepID=UPI0034B17138
MKSDLKKLKKVLSQTPPQDLPDTGPEDLFREAVSGVTPLTQDTVSQTPSQRLRQKRHQARSTSVNRASDRQLNATFSFSDMYEATLPAEGPVRYCRQDVPTHALKRLRRGDYYPELVLDLHGLTREAAKAELAALLFTARKENIDCVSVMHGLGKGILKQALPHYLVQHPHVMAFHQAPLEYGGQGALLVLIETAEPDLHR